MYTGNSVGSISPQSGDDRNNIIDTSIKTQRQPCQRLTAIYSDDPKMYSGTATPMYDQLELATTSQFHAPMHSLVVRLTMLRCTYARTHAHTHTHTHKHTQTHARANAHTVIFSFFLSLSLFHIQTFFSALWRSY